MAISDKINPCLGNNGLNLVHFIGGFPYSALPTNMRTVLGLVNRPDIFLDDIGLESDNPVARIMIEIDKLLRGIYGEPGYAITAIDNALRKAVKEDMWSPRNEDHVDLYRVASPIYRDLALRDGIGKKELIERFDFSE